MPGNAATGAPLLDPVVLVDLAAELGGRESAEQIARLYLEHLPTRVLRLCDAHHRGDLPALLDAALSLRSSSASVGASALHSLGVAVVAAVRAEDLVAVGRALSDLDGLAARTATALAAALTDAS